MLSSPLISVIMPAYNAEAYIRKAVESVVQQSYPNWELIIVDDLSSDHTGEIIDAMQSDRIRVFHNEVNLKTANTRNFAIRQSKGDWVAFLDSDDSWDQNKLLRQVELMQKHPEAKLMFTGSAFMDEEGNRKDYVLHVPSRINHDEILKQNLISCSSVLASKECLLKHPFPHAEMLHEDFAVWLAILKEVPYAYGVDEPLLIYRLSSGSKSGNKLKAAMMNWNTYRYSGLSVWKAALSMVSYTVRSLKKYSQLK